MADRKGATRGANAQGSAPLSEAVKLWPTPTATTYGSSNNGCPHDGRAAYATARSPSLETLIRTLAAPMEPRPDEPTKLWPTPNASDANGARAPEQVEAIQQRSAVRRRTSGGPAGCSALREAVLWPTPTATDAKASGAAGYSTASGRHAGTTLTDAVVRGFWPTPAAADGMGGPGAAPSMLGSPNLRTEITRWATPISRDAKGPSTRARRHKGGDLPAQAGGSGKLNPLWVERLMGFPEAWTDIGGPLVAAKRSTPGSRRAR